MNYFVVAGAQANTHSHLIVLIVHPTLRDSRFVGFASKKKFGSRNSHMYGASQSVAIAVVVVLCAFAVQNMEFWSTLHLFPKQSDYLTAEEELVLLNTLVRHTHHSFTAGGS